MAKRNFPLSRVYTLLEPGPVVLVGTAHKGRRNLMTMSWHTMMEFEPPLIGCVISDRNHSFAALKATKQCTINIPTVELAGKVVAVGNTHGADVDKFARFGFTPKEATTVAAPLVQECYASLECIVVDTRLARDYCFFVLDVLKAWVDTSVKEPKTIHHRGHGTFVVDGRVMKLKSRMK